MRLLILGGGGFIGGHLAKYARDTGLYNQIAGLDIKKLEDWWQPDNFDLQIYSFDARFLHRRVSHMFDINEETHVVDLACDMGGMGFITGNEVKCMDSVDITLAAIRNSRVCNIKKHVYASSACVYPYVPGRLSEDLAYTGVPEPGYGEAKLFGERYAHFNGYSVVRFHNVYGPNGSWNDGREKAPAAACRKVAEAKKLGKCAIDVWGDGTAERTFLHVKDACLGVLKMLHTNTEFRGPVNIGSEELISVDCLHYIAMQVAGYECKLNHIGGPVGAPSRCSHNDIAKKELDWQPSISLLDGMRETYNWIEQEINK